VGSAGDKSERSLGMQSRPWTRRRSISLGALITAFALAALIGAAERGAADIPCSGKLLCITTTTQSPASRSFAATDGPPATAENSHYLTDTVTISNGATSSNLVNINLTVSWQDYVGPLDNLTPAATTTTEFRSGFSSSVPTGFTCTDTVSPITCTTPKSLGPGKSVTYTLVFRTAFEATSGTSASAMKIHADV